MTCSLGEVPSFDIHDRDVITFLDTTGEVYISTSQTSYQFTSMSLTITCTSDESIHMQPLRTVTDTFTVNFISPSALYCANSFDAYVFSSYEPDPFQTYVIDQENPTTLTLTPQFLSFSPTCPAICSLYEVVDGADISMPYLLPQASDPSFTSFDKRTGELVIQTNN